MMFALLLWGSSIVTSVVLSMYFCFKIDKSGVKRWGATGNPFTYDTE